MAAELILVRVVVSFGGASSILWLCQGIISFSFNPLIALRALLESYQPLDIIFIILSTRIFLTLLESDLPSHHYPPQTPLPVPPA